jgi:hypothetical protein
MTAVVASLDSRFNSDCVSVIEGISSVVKFHHNYEFSIRKLCELAMIDSDMCVADAKHLRSAPLCVAYANVTSLRQLASTMIEMKHSVVYKHFFSLVVYLMTLPVTSAACERAHSKVDLVKSAVRASMTSDRLEDLVLISSEKNIVDKVDLSVVVTRFALLNRRLPL